MSKNKNDEFIWTQGYRPRTIEDCILPVETKSKFKEYILQGQVPNLILSGHRGTGKTTAALAMCEEIGADVLFINAAVEKGIDVVRTKLSQFTSTVSINNNLKVIILDEADRGTGDFQDALKSFMESCSRHTRFILTTNHKQKIIPEIHSRCSLVEFKIPAAEKPVLAKQLMTRIKTILDDNNVEYDQKVLVEVIMRFFPDFRKCLNELQGYSTSGKIDIGILANFSDESLEELVTMMKNKKFTDIRKWIATNADMEPKTLYNALYTSASKYMETSSIPELVLILAKYSFQSTMVLDHEINNSACMVEIMSNCSFK